MVLGLFRGRKSRDSDASIRRCAVSLSFIESAYAELERGVTEDDAAIISQPILSSINLACGRDQGNLFNPIAVPEILRALSTLLRAGQLEDFMKIPFSRTEFAIYFSGITLFGRSLDVSDEAQAAQAKLMNSLDCLVMKLNKQARAKINKRVP